MSDPSIRAETPSDRETILGVTTAALGRTDAFMEIPLRSYNVTRRGPVVFPPAFAV